MDLAYALMDPYEAVIFVDATPRGEEPGTVYLIEAEVPEEGEVALDTHGMDPVKVIRLARVLGGDVPRTLVVGCEPQVVLSGEAYDDMLMELSEPVRAAVPEAVKMVESLVAQPARRRERGGGEIVKKLLFLVLVAGAALAYSQRSDIQRYLNMRNM